MPRRLVAGLARGHARLIGGLAWLAAASLAVICLLVIVDVAAYSTGFGSIGWTSDLAAYGLLYSTMLAAPWLLRVKGHVTLDSVRRLFPVAMQRAMEVAVCLLSIAACLLLTWGGLLLIDDSIARGAIDYRVLAIPRWLLYLPLPLGFGLMAVEFARVLLGRDTLYGSGTEGI